MRKRIGVRLPDWVLIELDEYVKRKGMSRNEFVVDAIRTCLWKKLEDEARVEEDEEKRNELLEKIWKLNGTT